jgi:hypothetical protein
MALRTKSLRKVYSKDDLLNRIQDSIKESLDPVLSDLLLNRVSLEETIGTTDTTIKHSLGRIPTGWIIYDNTVDARIWRVSWTNSEIVLRSSNTTPIKFFLF